MLMIVNKEHKSTYKALSTVILVKASPYLNTCNNFSVNFSHATHIGLKQRKSLSMTELRYPTTSCN